MTKVLPTETLVLNRLGAMDSPVNLREIKRLYKGNLLEFRCVCRSLERHGYISKEGSGKWESMTLTEKGNKAIEEGCNIDTNAQKEYNELVSLIFK